MLDLMAVGQGDGPMPLYMHTAKRILREMRMLQQGSGKGFDYQDFKTRILESDLSHAQLEPLWQRLEMLESFMPQAQALVSRQKGKNKFQRRGSEWEPQVWDLPWYC